MKLSMNLFANSVLAAGALFVHAGNVHAQVNDQNIIVLDLSGSMTELSTSTKSKYVVMKEKVNLDLDKIGARTNRVQHFEIRTFSGTGSQIIRPFATGTVGEIRTLIAGLAPPSGDTPLAGAACAAIQTSLNYEDYLVNNGLATDASQKYLYVYSDGLENNTPPPGSETPDCDESCTRCQGHDPSAAELAALANGTLNPDDLDAGVIDETAWGWAKKLYNTARTNDPTNPNNPVIGNEYVGAIINISTFFTYIPPNMTLLDVAAPEEADFSASSPFFSSQFVSTPYVDQITAGWEVYLRKLAERHRGTYKAFKPNAAGTALVTSGSLIGDVNKDGCVGKVDYQKMHQTDTWLKQTSPSKPHIYASDLDGDSWVRTSDNSLLIANYGRGVCAPGDL